MSDDDEYPLGYEPAVGSLIVSKDRKYKLTKSITVDTTLYAIAFNFIDSQFNDVFATAGENKVTVYHCTKEGNIIMMQQYEDDKGEEAYYTVSWASNFNGNSLLVAGGKNGFIRVIDAGAEKIHMTLVGHGQSINEIKTQAQNPSLIASASKDESIRLWNLDNGVQIFILAGEMGHRFEVLSVDFHQSDSHKILSCGMDCTIKLWSLKEFWGDVEKSFAWTDEPSKFPTKCIQFPLLTFSVHNEFVDCCRWIGDFVLSKSVEHELLLWDPTTKEGFPNEGEPDILHNYPAPDTSLWFLKFSCDFHLTSVAIGNNFGTIYVWNLRSSPPVLLARLIYKNEKGYGFPIRQTAMSFDGSTILACDDGGNIWRWDDVKSS